MEGLTVASEIKPARPELNDVLARQLPGLILALETVMRHVRAIAAAIEEPPEKD